MQKRLVSLINFAGKKLDSYMQKSETNTWLYHMNKLKWVKDLNVRLKTIKLLEENSMVPEISFNNIFESVSSGKDNKSKNNLPKTKRFYTVKETTNKMKS